MLTRDFGDKNETDIFVISFTANHATQNTRRTEWKTSNTKMTSSQRQYKLCASLMSTTNANFQDSVLSGILPVKDQEHNLCPILISAYFWCQWKCFVTWTWTILPVQPDICLYQVQGLALFGLLHILSPASGQFSTSTDQVYHRKFSSKREEWHFSIHSV